MHRYHDIAEHVLRAALDVPVNQLPSQRVRMLLSSWLAVEQTSFSDEEFKKEIYHTSLSFLIPGQMLSSLRGSLGVLWLLGTLGSSM